MSVNDEVKNMDNPAHREFVNKLISHGVGLLVEHSSIPSPRHALFNPNAGWEHDLPMVRFATATKVTTASTSIVLNVAPNGEVILTVERAGWKEARVFHVEREEDSKSEETLSLLATAWKKPEPEEEQSD
jgi:hypothetical protein